MLLCVYACMWVSGIHRLYAHIYIASVHTCAYAQRPEEDARCSTYSLYLITLRQGFFLNLHISWWSVSPREPLVFTSCSDGCTDTHVLSTWMLESKFSASCFHSRWIISPVTCVYIHECDIYSLGMIKHVRQTWVFSELRLALYVLISRLVCWTCGLPATAPLIRNITRMHYYAQLDTVHMIYIFYIL